MTKKIIKYAFITMFICGAQWACHAEWAEDVVHNMSDSDYERIKGIIGETASDVEVAEYYTNEKK